MKQLFSHLENVGLRIMIISPPTIPHFRFARSVTLSLEIPGKTSFHPLKFCKIKWHPLEISALLHFRSPYYYWWLIMKKCSWKLCRSHPNPRGYESAIAPKISRSKQKPGPMPWKFPGNFHALSPHPQKKTATLKIYYIKNSLAS